jgi:cyclopropane-fatty-acyl-phospholipid synthase
VTSIISPSDRALGAVPSNRRPRISSTMDDAGDPHAGAIRPTEVRPVPSQVTAVDRAARAILLRMLQHLRHGRMTIIEQDGTVSTHGDGAAEPVVVRLSTSAVWTEVASKGSRGLGESFVDGWWTTDDLQGLLQLLVRNLDGMDRIRNRWARASSPVADTWRRLRPASRRRDRREIAAHYDLGNDFFELFLDPTMAYSCGLFTSPDATLAQAQVTKYDRLLRSIDLQPGERLVEIGTGWGGLAIHAAQVFGARVTTTTISVEQHRYATELVAFLGLEDQVTVLLEDYRDLTGTYDKLVSVEMIEAVDWRDHDAFFATCNRLLEPEGRMALQAITVADSRFARVRTTEDFVKRHVFPGSCIPSVEAILASTKRTGDFWLTQLDEFPQHYAETLHRWRDQLFEQADAARERGYDDALLRLWEFYLAYCEAAFAERYVSLVQLVLERPRSVPTELEVRR